MVKKVSKEERAELVKKNPAYGKIVCRCEQVTEGEILIDGINVRDMRFSDLRKNIALVSQETYIFKGTIFDNIAYSLKLKKVDKAERKRIVTDALSLVQLEGYEKRTPGELSGGQRQRLSIARAILKNPPILILDEATSALDTESERLVQEALERLMKSRTTIAIAHRLSTIRHADEICVMLEGEIVERGTHEELLAKGGYYKRLNDMQSL